MATGPDHYREAEQLLATAMNASKEIRDETDATLAEHLPHLAEKDRDYIEEYAHRRVGDIDRLVANLIAAAQVHATLALAAATIHNEVSHRHHPDLLHRWSDAVGVVRS